MPKDRRLAVLGSLVAFSFAIPACSSAADSKKEAIVALEAGLKDAREVRFYFVNRTEEYDYSTAEIIAHSTIRVTRFCDRICSFFMRDVVVQLRESVPVKCMKGQQNVLVLLGDDRITYSHGGRHIAYHGNCFLNRGRTINDVIERREFLF